MLCGRFEKFGSYPGNRGPGWGRMEVTGVLDGRGSAKYFENFNKISLFLVRIWVLALLR